MRIAATIIATMALLACPTTAHAWERPESGIDAVIDMAWAGSKCAMVTHANGAEQRLCATGKTEDGDWSASTLAHNVHAGDSIGLILHTSMSPDVPWATCVVRSARSGKVVRTAVASRELGMWDANCKGVAKVA